MSSDDKKYRIFYLWGCYSITHSSFHKVLLAECQTLVGVTSKLCEYYISHTSKTFKNRFSLF